MKVKEIERIITLEFKEEELNFIIGILRSSNNDSAVNLAAVLKETLLKA